MEPGRADGIVEVQEGAPAAVGEPALIGAA